MQHHAARAVDDVNNPAKQRKDNLPGGLCPKTGRKKQGHQGHDGQGHHHNVDANAGEPVVGFDLFGNFTFWRGLGNLFLQSHCLHRVYERFQFFAVENILLVAKVAVNHGLSLGVEDVPEFVAAK